jgi:hypothetical protein
MAFDRVPELFEALQAFCTMRLREASHGVPDRRGDRPDRSGPSRIDAKTTAFRFDGERCGRTTGFPNPAGLSDLGL